MIMLDNPSPRQLQGIRYPHLGIPLYAADFRNPALTPARMVTYMEKGKVPLCIPWAVRRLAMGLWVEWVCGKNAPCPADPSITETLVLPPDEWHPAQDAIAYPWAVRAQLAVTRMEYYHGDCRFYIIFAE